MYMRYFPKKVTEKNGFGAKNALQHVYRLSSVCNCDENGGDGCGSAEGDDDNSGGGGGDACGDDNSPRRRSRRRLQTGPVEPVRGGVDSG